MRGLQWTVSDAVFVTEMDDEHKEIFEALAELQAAFSREVPPEELRKLSDSLISRLDGHFAHEERLMRASRYGSFGWHKLKHDGARKRVAGFAERLQRGESGAGSALVEYLTGWMRNHARVADMMLGAFLRNHRRGLVKIVIRTGTRPIDSCEWADSRGERFDPGDLPPGY